MGHGDNQGHGQGGADLDGGLVVESLGDTTALTETLDGRMVGELRETDFALHKLDESIVDPERILLPDSLGVTGRTLGGGGLGGDGRHEIPLSLA